jgi:hypothetical protein
MSWYCPQTEIKHPDLPDVVWSLVLTCFSEGSLEALGEFLSNNAPHDELRVGREIRLYEGPKEVAVATVLEVVE